MTMPENESLGNRSHALIIATDAYEDSGLGALRSPSRDAVELAQVLQDPMVAGFHVQSLMNRPGHLLREEIEGFFIDRRREDLLVLYISGHGVKDPVGQLHFATTTTKLKLLASTGVSSAFVYEQVDRCRAGRILLLLDCCYSGAYASGYRHRAGDHVDIEPLVGRGRAVITSSTALEYAFEIDTGAVTGAPSPSVFTAAVIQGLRTGEADRDGDGFVSVDDLYGYVFDQVRNATPHQTPEKKWGEVRGDFIIAKNPNAQIARTVRGQAEFDQVQRRPESDKPKGDTVDSHFADEERLTTRPDVNAGAESTSPIAPEGTVVSSVTPPIIWGNVPQRNKNFTGREELLLELRRRVTTDAIARLPHALHGLGGVGKTQLAVEYAYRHAGEYQVVWWIAADQTALVRSTLAALAPRLGLHGIAPGRIEDAVSAVFDALRRGEPYSRWLLIFDNADQPELIRDFMPSGPGHVIVTSRNRGWAHIVDALEVDIFTRQESVAYLHRRITGIEQSDAARLADELGDLPLALEQAAALLAETAMTVEVYLRLLSQESDRVLGENPPSSDYPLPVAAAWSLSVSRLNKETPYALELLQLCAFFGSAPISLEILDKGRYVLGSPLRETLRDPILMSRALRALGRYSLARIDTEDRTLQVHRIIQRLIRNELDPDARYRMQHEVHILLAASDPGDPEAIESWPKFSVLLPHIAASELIACEAVDPRLFAQNVVRFLHITGNYIEALSFADRALTQWSSDAREDDKIVLAMTLLKAQVLRGLGRYRESYALSGGALERMRATLGMDHEETLIYTTGFCLDLRARGDFVAALELSRTALERHHVVFGDNSIYTLTAMSSLAEDLELNGEYHQAVRLNEQIYEGRLVAYRRDDHPLVLFTLSTLARAIRENGRYPQARDVAERAHEGFRSLVLDRVLAEGHPWMLRQAIDLSVARRLVAAFAGALELAQETYDGYRRTLGADHPGTLIASLNLGNALLQHGEIRRAIALLEEAVPRFRSVLGDNHPYTLGGILNLSLARRRGGDVRPARLMLKEALGELVNRLGTQHHYSLICMAGLASALAELGETVEAVQLEETALSQFGALIGEDHPQTLSCAANLSLDLKLIGQTERAEEIASRALLSFEQILGNDHPDTKGAKRGSRLDLFFDPPPVL